MSSYDEVNRLLRRAEKFRKDAISSCSEGYYDIACFYAEQAVQLRIKAYMLKNLGFMPRVHDVRDLLSTIYKYTNDERVREFVNRNRSSLKDLEEGYTETRYGTTEYTEEDAKECLNIMEELFNLVVV
ncbi:HEPN domain-containing protein [Stygiolobus caldivivus]|uniref:DNA-binding protein n=1 Tax=Stygiolobus caldivivus TaxID=2824673 RepID=A0A8D5ZHN1_9CREN|nr:HEPN domain-containing protein [Stygiolobus caldivivus]BCU69854.1 DNA-binding protein [Stygiolobus caldivivus]